MVGTRVNQKAPGVSTEPQPTAVLGKQGPVVARVSRQVRTPDVSCEISGFFKYGVRILSDFSNK